MEVNSRVNYPIKEVLVDMLEKEEILMDDPSTQFCVSSFVMKVINVGVSSFVSSWNAHPIPGLFFETCTHVSNSYYSFVTMYRTGKTDT